MKNDLPSFSHLSDDEFNQACTALIERFYGHGHKQEEWLSVELVNDCDIKYLRITKKLPLLGETPHNRSEIVPDEHEEDDDEALCVISRSLTLIYYDITLSPVYRVPTLYFSVSDPQHRFPPTMETLYSHVIPPQFKAQAESVGVIGGITINDHPSTNRPVFFIHPCRTAELMQASVGNTSINASDYLSIWIGALGKCVGLNIPVVLARSPSDEDKYAT